MVDWSERTLDELNVDFGTRPKAPEFKEVTSAQKRSGWRLAAIHRMHLNDIGRIAIFLDQMETKSAAARDLHALIAETDFAQNLRQFGTLCGRECKVLTFHHDAEEYSLFPELAQRGNDELRAVVERLVAEHKVVHELLTRLERAAMTLMFEPTPENYDLTRMTFHKLEEVIRSHFGYEETQLADAIGALEVGL